MFLPEWIARHAFAASAFPFRGVRAFFSALLNFAQRVRCLILGPPPYVDPMDRHIENREYHEGFMRQAIDMGELALVSDETPVGCVFVHKGEVIGRGMNETNRSLNGTRHAEFAALSRLLLEHDPRILPETTLYVTVEPCVMCASALRQYGIGAVYFGCSNDRFGGTGGVLRIHSDPSVDPPTDVYGGLFREEAIMLLRRFYVQENDKAPEPHRKANRELKTEIMPIKAKQPLAEISNRRR